MFDYSESDRRKVWETIKTRESESKEMNLRCGLAIYDALRILLESIGEIGLVIEKIENKLANGGDENGLP